MKWMPGLIALSCLIFKAPSSFAKETLGVFLATEISPNQLERVLKKDKALQDFDIKVYSQIKDFTIANEVDPFDFVILPSVFFKFNKNFQASYQFTYKGEKTFRYHVLSLEKEWTVQRMQEGTVGLIEEVERQHSKILVQEILEGKYFKRMKQVSRVQDLYPMLALGNSNYILISPNVWEGVQKTISAQPIMIIKTLELNYPQLGYASQKKDLAAKVKDLAKLSKDSIETLGFSALEQIEGK